MTMPLRVEILLVALREILRVVALPFHLLAFLPRRGRHLRGARDALQGGSRPTAGVALVVAPTPPHRVFLSCGEASGEELTLRLLDAATSRCAASGRPLPQILAFGGARLQARGVDLRFPLADHAVMGIAGVLASIPLILRAFATYLRILRDERPDLVFLVDYPGLHLVMAEAARRRGIPVVHYVAPQYWAWGPWRMERYRRAVDATLTILPFEPAFFQSVGLRSEYVGHPLLDAPRDPPHEALAGPARVLLLLPGSRRKEIALHLLPMVEVARRLRALEPDMRVIVAHRDERRIAAIRALLAGAHDVDFVEVLHTEPRRVLSRAHACLVKSGTGSLEASLARVPSVIVYVVQGPVARLVRRHLLTVPFFGSANLCMARQVQPEIAIESTADWQRAGDELAALWRDGPRRAHALADLDALRTRLGEPGASTRAARLLCDGLACAQESRT